MVTLASIQTKFRSLTEKTTEVHRIMRTSQYPSSHPEAVLLLQQAATYQEGAVFALAGKTDDSGEAPTFSRIDALQNLCDDCLNQAKEVAIRVSAEQDALVKRASRGGRSCI